jgi:hypothetical protein
MAEEPKRRLDRRSRNQIKRLLVMWYSQLEREQLPTRFNDVLSLSSTVGTSLRGHTSSGAVRPIFQRKYSSLS